MTDARTGKIWKDLKFLLLPLTTAYIFAFSSPMPFLLLSQESKSKAKATDAIAHTKATVILIGILPQNL